MKKIYILDTNVFLTNSNSIYEYKNNDIVIPLKVLDEIDKHKKRQDGVGLNARNTIRILDELRSKGNLHKGVRIDKGLGILSVKGFDHDQMPVGCDIQSADNQIIATALTEQAANPKRKIILVTRDINMRVKCDSLEMLTEDYEPAKIIENQSELYVGYTEHLVDDQIVNRFYEGEEIYLDDEQSNFQPNEFIMLVSSTNEKKTALAKFNMLMDPSIPIVTLIGAAGCGKTLLAIAAGLEQVLDQEQYKKLVVSRPVQPLGKDIGYLPGTMEEKMMPWLMPIQDNIEFLMNGKRDSMDMFFENGTIQVEALTYIRGRSISNGFMIIDEAQNLTTHELKTIITRVGENTKIVLTGDIEQIDNVYIDATSNGLSYAVEKFKTYDLSGHITLKKGERSKVATLASKVL